MAHDKHTTCTPDVWEKKIFRHKAAVSKCKTFGSPFTSTFALCVTVCVCVCEGGGGGGGGMYVCVCAPMCVHLCACTFVCGGKINH